MARGGQHRRDAAACRSSSCARTTASRRSARRPTSIRPRRWRRAELTDLVHPFGVPAVAIDGTDAGAVHAAMAEALERARGGGGPSFIEARTVRWPGNRPLWPQLGDRRDGRRASPGTTAHPGEHAHVVATSRTGSCGIVRELLAAGHVSRAACPRDRCGGAWRRWTTPSRSRSRAPTRTSSEALEDVYRLRVAAPRPLQAMDPPRPRGSRTRRPWRWACGRSSRRTTACGSWASTSSA